MIRRALLLLLILAFGLPADAVPRRPGFRPGIRLLITYDPAASDLFARMAIQPDSVRKGLINNVIVTLKSGPTSGTNIWNKLDALYIFAAADSQSGLLNWKSASFTATSQGSPGPTFTVDRGFAGDGIQSYLETSFNASTAGGQFTQNSATFGLWSRTAGTVTNEQAGGQFDGTDGIQIVPRSMSASKLFVRLNSAMGTTSTATVASGAGLFTASRSNSTTVLMYQNGVNVPGVPDVSAALNNGTINFGRLGGSAFYGSQQLAAGMIGSNLTAAESLDLYNALQAYMTGVGA